MRARTLLSAGALAFLGAACAKDDETQVLPPVVVGLLDTTPAAVEDGEDQIFQVSRRVELPLRRPKEGERPEGEVAPYPRPPFQLASDTRITLRFTLSNLENEQRTVELLIDPWNEFVRYEPGLQVGEDTTPNLSGIDRFIVLPPLGRVEGIITPDDMVELAVDLGTAMNLDARPPAADGDFAGPGLFNRAFNVQNRSSEPDPLLSPFFPQRVAGIVGFDLGLRAYQKSKIAVEVVIDLEDVQGDRVVKLGDTEAEPIGRPGSTLSPPAPAVE
jgi:hypothetical protein